jgi:hypothetical protein
MDQNGAVCSPGEIPPTNKLKSILYLAAEQPAKLQQMVDSWKGYARDNGVIISDPLSSY